MKRGLLTWGCAFVAGLVGSAASVLAQESLSEVQLFYRCYAQLTEMRPKRSDPLLAQVRSGQKTAFEACSQILQSARFTAEGGTKISSESDTVAKAVLRAMHHLHRSWARDQGLFPIAGSEIMRASETWYDYSPLGDYVTRALFSPNHNVDSVLSGSEYLQPVRMTMNPSPTYPSNPNTPAYGSIVVPSYASGGEREFRLGSLHPFAPRGEILGIRAVSRTPIEWTRFGNTAIPNFPLAGLTPEVTQAITEINFPDEPSVRGPLSESTQYAIWIQGQLIVPETGSYTLYVDVDDQAQLYIDGTRVLDKTINSPQGSGSEGSVVRALTAGSHALQVRYRQLSGTAKLILSWESATINKQVVPSTSLSGLQASYYLHGPPQTIRLTANEGGGFIGNQNYLLTTYRENSEGFVPDGRLGTNRSWARAVLHDTLCRDVPVVREEDVTAFVNPESSVPFRQNAGCTTCHASLDRQAGLIRGLRFSTLQSVTQTSPAPDWYGILGMRFVAPTQTLRTDWSDQADPNYALRPAFGNFYFRNLHGALIDQPVYSIEELASAIKGQDDYYVCFAKRYYQYFLGIDVTLGDPQDPAYRTPTGPDSYHLNRVISLGQSLRGHKSLERLILDILASEDYRKSDYGVTAGGVSAGDGA